MLKLNLTVSEGQMHHFILRAPERGKQLGETSKMISLSNAMTAKGAGLLYYFFLRIEFNNAKWKDFNRHRHF